MAEGSANVPYPAPEGRPSLAQRFTACGKKPALPLLLGGAAVYRCGNCLVLNSALAAEGAALDQELLFPQAVEVLACRLGGNSVFSHCLGCLPLFFPSLGWAAGRSRHADEGVRATLTYSPYLPFSVLVISSRS